MRERDARSRCVMLCIIEAMGYFVCVSVMIFAALARNQMCRVILACLLSWLKRHCNYSTTYGQLLRWVRELEVFYSHAHMWHADVPNTSTTGALLSGHKHFIELLKWSKVRLISDGFSDFHIFSTYFFAGKAAALIFGKYVYSTLTFISTTWVIICFYKLQKTKNKQTEPSNSENTASSTNNTKKCIFFVFFCFAKHDIYFLNSSLFEDLILCMWTVLQWLLSVRRR